MIENLFNEGLNYGVAERAKSADEIRELRRLLLKELDENGQSRLDRLCNAYIQQNSAISRDVFIAGFSTAVHLLLESLYHETHLVPPDKRS